MLRKRMQEDFYPAAEKILCDIDSIIRNDPDLKSFEILPTLQDENKSPVHYEEHSLGLESWCVPHIYCYAYKNLISIKQSTISPRDIEKCDTLLIGALLLNPDVTTFWNMRKEYINCGKLDPYFDLHFTSIVLSYKPKCADVYAYRKWILKKVMNEDFEDCLNILIVSPHHGVCTFSVCFLVYQDSPSDMDNVMKNEFQICEAAADRHSNNYHAWTHRMWCLNGGTTKLFLIEFSNSFFWICKHMSDYSGFHYRQKLISHLLRVIQTTSYDTKLFEPFIVCAESAAQSFVKELSVENFPIKENLPLSLKLLLHELLNNTFNITEGFGGHETLWCHRKYIFHTIKGIIFHPHEINNSWGYFDDSTHSNEDGVPVEKTSKIEVKAVMDSFSVLLSFHEAEFLKQCFTGKKSQQTTYAKRHEHWLERFSKFVLPPPPSSSKFEKDLFHSLWTYLSQ